MLSFALDAANAVKAPPAPRADERRPRVLIVEDDPVLSGLFRAYLEGEELEYTVVSSVVAAEQKLAAHPFDLLLLDISLPGEDGLSFYRRARRTLPPTIFMSAIDRLLHAGSDIPSSSWLPKPFGPEELIQRLHEGLGRGGRGSAIPAVTPTVDTEALSLTGAESSSEKPPRILLVEDDPTLRELIAEFLEWSGFAVAQAGRLSEARDALKAACDAVVLDGRLPDGDGLELIKTIRATPGRERLPILMLSGRASASDEQASRDAGADAHLAKPFTEEELVARLRNLIQRKTRPRA